MSPDRGKSDRDDPRACNPMTNRIPGEVMYRRRRPDAAASVEQEGAVIVDKKAVFTLKPEQRLKWLLKALKQAGDGIIHAGELYEVVSSTRFAEELPLKVGRKMALALKSQLAVFTGKQQKFIAERAEICVRYVPTDPVEVPVPAKAKRPKEVPVSAPSAAEEMMARCRDFMRTKQAERGERGQEEGGGGLVADDGADVAVATTIPIATASTFVAAKKLAMAANAEVAAAFADMTEEESAAVPTTTSRDREQSKEGGNSKDGAKQPPPAAEDIKGVSRRRSRSSSRSRQRSRSRSRSKSRSGKGRSRSNKRIRWTDRKKDRRSRSHSGYRRNARNRSRSRSRRGREKQKQKAPKKRKARSTSSASS
eukprot:TRINITY_DN73663_c0_g1_i1.p1 TRINITY_DN73663_c0_g1~~TRINITY_DN73663_c0_g1_i1.p1  ORF type:complete len:429 (-),score=76.63 TRINITY_DN73663_c0_g1_i1:324-1421(-)